MEKKRFYLTKQGLEKIKKQYQELRRLRKSKSKEGVPQVFHSEEVNPDYLVFQEDMSFLEDQIAEFKFILKNAKLIKPPSKEKQNIVHLGASVLVETDDGQLDEFKIVGSLEANPSLGRISNESPVGKVLLGRKVGEEVVVQSAIKTVYKIKSIRYNIDK